VALRLSSSPARRARLLYDRQLEDPQLLADSLGRLREGQLERGLYFGPHPLCVSLRPELIDRDEYRKAQLAAQAVFGALSRLERALLADEGIRGELDLRPEEERLALADPGYPHSSPSSRLDSFAAPEIGYVEYNAESPAGMAYGDELSRIFWEMPAMLRLRERFRLRPLRCAERQLEVMLAAYRAWGGTALPRVAIVDWAGLPTLAEFELFRAAFLRRGIPAIICQPAELTFTRGELRGPSGEVLNLVYRRVLEAELLAEAEAAEPLCTAYLEGAVCVVNSFRAKLLHKKMSLALLSDPRWQHIYTPPQRRAIARHVPWTRKLQEGATERHGHRVPDLLDHVATHQREMVLKPNDEYGGKGVILGWTVSRREWEQALTVGLSQSYVVQEAIPVPRDRYPVAVGDAVQELELGRDMDPYLFNGRVGGVLTRLSSSALLNVTAGEGSVVPAFVVEEAA
jgi:uncharacterized circularly permuted ATP-grasp superfamily protein